MCFGIVCASERSGFDKARLTITGEWSANHYARCALYEMLESLHDSFAPKGLRIGQWVGDVNFRKEGDAHDVVAVLADSAAAFSAAADRHELEVSGKSLNLASPRELGMQVRDASLCRGVRLKFRGVGLDLGLERGHRRRDDRLGHRRRVQRAWGQMKRLARAARTSASRRATRKLTLMSPVPRELYGAAAMGMAPTARARAERAVAAVIGGVRHGRCRRTFLAIELGGAGPSFQAIRRLMGGMGGHAGGPAERCRPSGASPARVAPGGQTPPGGVCWWALAPRGRPDVGSCCDPARPGMEFDC